MSKYPPHCFVSLTAWIYETPDLAGLSDRRGQQNFKPLQPCQWTTSLPPMCVATCEYVCTWLSHVPNASWHDSPPVMVLDRRDRKMGLEVNLRLVQFIRFLKRCGSSRRRQVESGEIKAELQNQHLGLMVASHTLWKPKQKHKTYCTSFASISFRAEADHC